MNPLGQPNMVRRGLIPYCPLWLIFGSGSCREDFDELDLRSDAKIFWEVYADNAPKTTGSVMIRDIEFVSRE